MSIENINKVFFIGIGGIGMSGLARYFIDKGITVLGYDREKSFITEGLKNLGVHVIYDPSKLNLSEFIDYKKETLIVYTSKLINCPLEVCSTICKVAIVKLSTDTISSATYSCWEICSYI